MLFSLISCVRKLDWLLLGGTFGLVGLGMLSIYSSSVARGNFSNLEKQLIFFAIGLACMFVVSLFDYRLMRNDPYLILLLYAIGVLALVGLLLFAPEIRGSKGWYRIFGISVDPIEYVKLLLVILMAKYFSVRHVEAYRVRHIL